MRASKGEGGGLSSLYSRCVTPRPCSYPGLPFQRVDVLGEAAPEYALGLEEFEEQVRPSRRKLARPHLGVGACGWVGGGGRVKLICCPRSNNPMGGGILVSRCKPLLRTCTHFLGECAEGLGPLLEVVDGEDGLGPRQFVFGKVVVQARARSAEV